MRRIRKGINTPYHDCLFRSRTEARWAVFFDAIGIQWQYEPEGFDLGPAGLYLPDFRLPACNVWVEIKSEEPSPAELSKCLALLNRTDADVWLIYGQPRMGQHRIARFDADLSGEWLHYDEFSECRKCDGLWIASDNGAHGFGPHTCGDNWKWPAVGARVTAAYKRAGNARFEFGAQPSQS